MKTSAFRSEGFQSQTNREEKQETERQRDRQRERWIDRNIRERDKVLFTFFRKRNSKKLWHAWWNKIYDAVTIFIKK